MIQITSFPPSPKLVPYVHFMWRARTTQSIGVQPVVTSPTGFVLLTIFTDDSRYQVKLQGKEFETVPRAVLQAQHYGPSETRTQFEETSTIGVMFKTTAIHQLWGFNMEDLTHKIVDAETLFGDSFKSVVGQLQQEESDEEKLKRMTAFIEQAIDHQKKKLVQAGPIVDLMYERKGTASIRDLAGHFQYTPRLIERKFRKQVGVSPKYLNRIIQFNNVLTVLKEIPEMKWSELAHRTGYYDQAHLVKAFIEFTGKSPVKYEEKDNRVTQTHLVKNARQEIVHTAHHT